MSPATTRSYAVYGPIDPEPETSENEEMAEQMDFEMTMNSDEQLQDDDRIMEQDTINDINEDRIIIAVDFGTTFSSVAYTVLPRGMHPDKADIRGVKCVGNYPGYQLPPGVPNLREEVPTEIWYNDGYIERMRSRNTSASSGAQNSADENDNYICSEDDDDDEDEQEGHSRLSEDDSAGDNPSTKAPKIVNKAIVTQYWGYGVEHKLQASKILREDARPLFRFKLNLSHSPETESVREGVKKTLIRLKRRKVIKNDEDVYLHYLTNLLQHTKQQLLLSREFHADMAVQFVLCVPARWPTRACRIMQISLESAVREVDFGSKANRSLHSIFMISEPEAAAECILAEGRSEVLRNETIVILDAGGGTVDAVTYSCDHGDPLRLTQEVVSPNSKLCGSSFINERFKKRLLEKLDTEKYLENNELTLKSIAQSKTAEFELYQKRIIDVTDKKTDIDPIYINYLKHNARRNFSNNFLQFKRSSMYKFFEESLRETKEVLENQLELAESKGRRVEKVILTGGFGQSPSLQSYLRKYLKEREQTSTWLIELIIPPNPSTAVARGAILRALNKRFGPKRHLQCSYGFIISELYDPKGCEAHQGKKSKLNKVDGLKYIDETIQWVIPVGKLVENMEAFAFPVVHSIPTTRKRLICREQLWVSDTVHENHYRRTHAVNKGAELAGTIEADLTFLRDQGLIEPKYPGLDSEYAGSKKAFWEVNYEVALIVEGRSIRFEARWPTKENLRVFESQQVLGAKLIGIAAALRPGTA